MSYPYTNQPLTPIRTSLRDRVRGISAAPVSRRILQPTGQAILEWIGVNDLKVDDYQRKVSSPHVRAIVRNFNSDTFGIITVALREDGSLYVVDGQHRVIAIRSMQAEGDNQEVQCVVIAGWTSVQEAQFFSESQRNRKGITPGQAHNAEVYAQDEVAVAIETAVRNAGFRISGQVDGEGGQIKAVGALYRITRAYGAAILSNTLLICAAAWGTDNPPQDNTINGVSLFIFMYPSLNYQRLVDKLGEETEDSLISKSKSISASMNYRLQDAIAQELFNRYNYRMSAHKLTDLPGRLEVARAFLKKHATTPRKPGAPR